ncbi:hypothetical protein COU96_02020 [Candidatus Shapirobacteria bacterium CG10_big_fil_rev_8_21_14_0_10_38_14]|uniref:Uncharacterized protein n=1 Tax=Candidatus Shapirobacteria bacterium CG10_big_fil_rev_8_21_14_0_10_38_14 TaxID=1974483 RepID=A0A2M8L5A5_9BACT|nr:MAG: hypothetical protein COU96_02020 [Candidatus Shapirobacteria bacterium CG10_big_fil_rev_8_21_14_0_10_38_14]
MNKGKAVLLFFSFVALLNFLILDIKVFRSQEEPSVVTPTTLSPKIGEISFCPAACLEAISQATAPAFIQTTPTPKPTQAEVMVKELYIPLGSGSTKSVDWVELAGVESVIDAANYPKIKSVIFEASLRIPTANGRVYAKLYNVTDKHDVWFSEVWAEGPLGYRAESGKISLSPGRKLYRVMMKSTMAYEAILDSARIKILLE